MNFPQINCSSAFGSDAGGLLARSSLYREFLAERDEVMRHRWFESEKAGHDVGFEEALVNWVVHHRARWQRERRQAMADC